MELININSILKDLLFILFGAFGVGAIIYLIDLIYYLKTKWISKNWKVGDKVKVNHLSSVNNHMQLHNLVGWNKNHFFVEENSFIHQCEWRHLEFNKSAEWRKSYIECEKFMSQESPKFPEHIYGDMVGDNELEKTLGPMVNNKLISKLSKTECEILLKQALEEENYEIAELLRIRIESLK